MVLRPYSPQKASKDIHSVHYFHAVVPNLHQNCTKHEEGKATIYFLCNLAKSLSYFSTLFCLTSFDTVHFVGSGNGALDLGRAAHCSPFPLESASMLPPYPGFHSLPPRTVREVFPHTALRQPSSWLFRVYASHLPG